MARQSRGHSCAALTSSRSPLQIRPYEPPDWPAVWPLLEPVFRAGETFPHDPAISEAEAHSWPEVLFPDYGWIPFETTGARPELTRLGLPQASTAAPSTGD